MTTIDIVMSIEVGVLIAAVVAVVVCVCIKIIQGKWQTMKSNIHRKLFSPDYFGWRYYCKNAARRQKHSDKQMAKKAARKARKTMEVDEDG